MLSTSESRVRTLEVNTQQAPIVKQVFEQYANGQGSTRIAAQLNAVGVPTQQGGRWTSSTVIQMIHNPVYIGYVTWDKRLSREIKKSSRCIFCNSRTVIMFSFFVSDSLYIV